MNIRFFALTLLSALAACGGGAGGGGSALPATSGGTTSSTSSPGYNGVPPTASPSPSAAAFAPLVVCGAIQLPVATNSGSPATAFSPTTTCAVSESSYTGPFSISDHSTCTNIITWTPTSFAGPSGSFSVTQIGGGTCTLAVSDANGQAATISVGSTWTTGTLDSRGR